MGNPSQNYGVSLPVWDHTVLLANWTHPAFTPASKACTQFTCPSGMEGWVDLGDLITPRPGVESPTSWSKVRSKVRCPNHCATKTACPSVCVAECMISSWAARRSVRTTTRAVLVNLHWCTTCREPRQSLLPRPAISGPWYVDHVISTAVSLDHAIK